MDSNSDLLIKYQETEEDCRNHILAILKSSSKKKIVVAGPGTGKTFLFKEILERNKNSLTLTFINSLVEDLSLELCGISDVKTLHSFALSILSRTNNSIEIYPKLSEVIKEDAKILRDEEIDFDNLFHNNRTENGHLDFYKRRKNYYGKYYGFADIVFALVKYFEKNEGKIPVYDQILVDEFQDFNKLEISLIDLLSKKSPIILTGDDDQALYESLKSADAKYIRDRYNDKNSEFVSFSLPYCRRSTRVIVETVNDVITVAKQNGLLKSRIEKRFEYFICKKKDIESNQNPRIIFSQQYATRIPYFIEQQLKQIAIDVKQKFSVLIISPTNTQSRLIFESLNKKGFTNIEPVKKREDEEPTLMDGYKLLLNDKNSDLGWRIASRFHLAKSNFELLLKKSNEDNAGHIFDLIDKEKKKEIKEILKILRAVKNINDVEITKLDEVFKRANIDPYHFAKNVLREKIVSDSLYSCDPELRKIPIKFSTIQSSKGLAADYVFITHFDNQFWIKNEKEILDREICNFIVSLTRARRKVFLISSDKNKESTFLQWINKDKIEIIN